jgi:hypothetical protein
VVHVKKLIRRHNKTGELKIRLMLNHLTILYNVFNPPMACTRMLALRLRDHLPQLKPMLLFLNYWPDEIKLIDGETIVGSNVPLDDQIVAALRSEFRGQLTT